MTDALLSFVTGPQPGIFALLNDGRTFSSPMLVSSLSDVTALAPEPSTAPGGLPAIVAARSGDAASVVLRPSVPPAVLSLEKVEELPPIHSNAVACADLDADGVAEVLSLNEPMDCLSVLQRSPDGIWSVRSFPVGVSPSSLTVNDFDGDGRPDVAIACRFGHGLTLLRNLGGLTFSAPAEITLGDRTWFVDKASSIASTVSADGKLVQILIGASDAPLLFGRNAQPDALRRP